MVGHRHTNRRFTALVSGVLTVAGCTTAQHAPTSKEVNIYTFAAYIPEQVVRDFEKTTGITAHVSTYETNEELLASMASRPGGYDVIVPSDYAVEMLIDADALLPLDLSNIPNAGNIDPAYLHPYFDPGGTATGGRNHQKNEKFSLPYLWGTTGIAYDKTKVTPRLTSWNDLWRPELAGKLVLLDDAREMLGIAALASGLGKNETQPELIAIARDKLKSLAPGVVAFDANNGENLLIDGTATAGVFFSGNAALAQRANPNIEWVLPTDASGKDAAGIWFDNLAIPTKAAHPDSAAAFINFVLSAEAGAKIDADYPFSNPNLAALDWMRDHEKASYDAYRNSPTTSPSPTALAGALLVKNVGPEASANYERAWTEVKAAKGAQ